MHAHIMTHYSTDHRMRYCAIRRCTYREEWDQAARAYLPPRNYTGDHAYDQAAPSRSDPEPTIAPVPLWAPGEGSQP